MKIQLINEVEELKERMIVLEKIVVSLITLEKISEKDLTASQRKLLRESLEDIKKRKYDNFLSLEDVKKSICS